MNYNISKAVGETGSGLLEIEFGDRVKGYVFRLNHDVSLNTASLQLFYNDVTGNVMTLKTTSSIGAFAYNTYQELRIECVWDTFLVYHNDVLLFDYEPTNLENTILESGFIKISAFNTNTRCVHLVESISFQPSMTITQPVFCNDIIYAKEFGGMKWDMIADNPLTLSLFDNDNSDNNVVITLGAEGRDNVAQIEVCNNFHHLGMGVNASNQDFPEIAYLKTFTSSALALGTNDRNDIYIDSSGNVGIGTNVPTVLLDVNGTIKADRVLGVSFADLANKPTIPEPQINADWNATSGVTQILNKPTIPTGGGINDGDEFVLCDEDIVAEMPLGAMVTTTATGVLADTTYMSPARWWRATTT
jgi:hypothetical protein